MNPQTDADVLRRMLEYKPKYFFWAGSDLFNVTTAEGNRQMIIVETNSCPSGQKSMPLISDANEFGGYRTVLGTTFKELLGKADATMGALAVIYDKNTMEASGYAAVLAEIMQEPVWLVEVSDKNRESERLIKWVDKVLHIQSPDGGAQLRTPFTCALTPLL